MTPVDSGVIGAIHPAGPGTTARGVDSVTVRSSGPIPDLPLGTLPAEVPSFQPPAFALARKEFEQGGPPFTGRTPGGLTGGAPTDETVAGTLGSAVAPAFDGALSAAQEALDTARTVLGDAQAALNGVPDALNAAQAAFARTAANPASALPPLPADPVGDLMRGLALPAIPGLDALFEPFLELLQSFGTGALGQLNPAILLSTGSEFIESAVQVGGGALKTVEFLWRGKASQSARESGRQAENHGQDTTQRGFDLSAITTRAAAVVRRGNIQLTAIAQAFAAEATALAPVILTPIGQTTLIASATRHLGEAVTVVNATHGELSVYTARVQGIIGQLLGQGGGPDPAEVAQFLAQNVGESILEQAKSLLDSGLQTATAMRPQPGKADPNVGGLPDTANAGVGGGGGGIGGGAGGLGSGRPSAPGGPGSSIPGGTVVNPADPFGAGMANVSGMSGPAGSSFMGSPATAGAGQGRAARQGRTVQPHQSTSAESELTGNLGMFAPGVIGRTEEAER
ncbi:hypothetical protein [Nocardia aurantiaca]|uniref:Uncharacterized protein n=1 Tax=Nocardia aurantiaca TaxID=2675850 RepID=A0A6I3L574_9NOCA|nr:hypothetical protein [Nocardia aurantiaca]MTE14989.1 hypothetical protein [Nocardia aurantiaca]